MRTAETPFALGGSCTCGIANHVSASRRSRENLGILIGDSECAHGMAALRVEDAPEESGGPAR